MEEKLTQSAKNHPFFDKYTILGAIVLVVVNELLYMKMAKVGYILTGEYYGYFGIPIAIILLLIFFLYFKSEFIGFFKGNMTSLGIRLAAIMLIYYAVSLLEILIFGQLTLPTLPFIGFSFMAGMCEETIFRGVLVTYLFRQWKEERRICTIVLISAVLFGLTHFMNILSGAPVDITICQVIATIGMGALFAAIYVRSGNIFVIMVIHGLTDLVAFMDSSSVEDDGIITASVSFLDILNIGKCMVLLIIALYLVRPAKYAEIKALWDKKWRRA